MASEKVTWEGMGTTAAKEVQAQPGDEQADSSAQGSNATGAAEEEVEAEDGADYDPESVSFDAAPQSFNNPIQDPPPSQRPPSAKPKMSGGFLVEVSDEDEDDNSQDPPAEDTVTHAEGQAASAGNGVSPALPTDAPSSVPQAMPTLDPVAFLEARIKEDPRGDMDAWLNLIADHKRRGRLNDLRKVYNRFVEVFPQAVSALHDTVSHILTVIPPGRHLDRLDRDGARPR